MPAPLQPRLRAVESFPVPQPGGEVSFALRDPQGFASSILLPLPAAFLASLMDGRRTLQEIQDDFARASGQLVSSEELEGLISDLDQRLFLDTDRFRAHWKSEVETFLNNPV